MGWKGGWELSELSLPCHFKSRCWPLSAAESALLCAALETLTCLSTCRHITVSLAAPAKRHFQRHGGLIASKVSCAFGRMLGRHQASLRCAAYLWKLLAVAAGAQLWSPGTELTETCSLGKIPRTGEATI